MNLKTGTTIKASDFPPSAVIDSRTGKVVTFADSRKWARQFADHEHGERIAKITKLTYEVSK